MNWSLLAVTYDLQLLLVILEVAAGLGMVIFVHELGHFVVAKLCGVKCEKFYLGFDIYGLKLFHYRWGETEYGIGILPLGGYVKMLGQDDNPSKAAEERERSTVKDPAAVVANAGPPALDPRSYMAKSVPQRMAIISAGVIMNVIFAVVLAAIAYSMGVHETACGISAVLPGEAAWQANLQPGDEIVKIGNSSQEQLRFRDLMVAVALGNVKKGVDFTIKREGVPEPFLVTVKPDTERNPMRPTIGVVPPRVPVLSDEKKAVIADTPAAAAGQFKPGDKILAVGDTQIATFADLEAALTRHASESLVFSVERGDPIERRKSETELAKSAGTEKEPAPPEHAEITVGPRPMRVLGLAMKMGRVTAIQEDSPAAKADVRPGDTIVTIDGQAPGDPLRLPEKLRGRAKETIALALSRQGSAEPIEKQIELRERPWPEESITPGAPVSVPALGLTYEVLNVVEAVEPESPAAKVQWTEDGKPSDQPLAAGDELVRVEFIATEDPDAEQVAASESDSVIYPATQPPSKPLELSAAKLNWPFVMYVAQVVPNGTQIKLTLKDGRTATLEPVRAADWFYYDRGLLAGPEITFTKARSISEALQLGYTETFDAVLQVYLFLRKIGTQVSLFGLGGPKSIAQAAGAAAYDGVPQLLVFLTMLSANLAVLNFLPIPLLDGGHMVFLALEGILRRPVSEKIVIAFHYLGFVFIISLMVFVLGLDFGLIPRPHM